MAKATIKTTENEASVEDFLAAIPGDQQREDSRVILNLMAKATKEPPRMWGSAIIGFGNRPYKSTSGREVDWMRMGFSPRKANLAIYLVTGLAKFKQDLAALGKHKTGVGCLYINKISDIDLKVLDNMIRTEAAVKL